MQDTRATRPGPLAPFRHTTYRSIWVANLVSSFGGLIQTVGAAWLMTAIANSVDMVALVQAATTLPLMLFSVVGGAVADTFNRRRVMLSAQIFMLCVSITLAITTYLGLINPWLLLAFTFLIGCGTALNNPSWQASVGDIVPRADLPGAIALNSIGFNLSRSLGPAIGGLIVGAAGATAAFGINALSYLPLIVILLLWKAPVTTSTLPRESMGSAMMGGLRYVAMSPNIGKVYLRGFAFGIAAVVVVALLPVVAQSLPGGGPELYGLLLGAFGIGAIGGALMTTRLQSVLPSETIIRIAFCTYALAAVVVGLSPNAWLTGLGCALAGSCWVLAQSLLNVTVQLSSPRWVVGRTLSLYQTSIFGGMAAGSWLWGVVADGQGVPVAMGGAALTLLAGAAIGLWLALPQRSAANLDPLNRWTAPHLELDVQPRSGPIVISVEYRILPADVAAFLDVMADRKRVRIRNGARHWVLKRDLEHPEMWTESYMCPTWTEYLRFNQRTTQADAEITTRIRALHRGEGMPVVRRWIERPPDWFASVERKDTIDPP
ncbi:MAG: MFS transporter [Devosia sp.]